MADSSKDEIAAIAKELNFNDSVLVDLSIPNFDGGSVIEAKALIAFAVRKRKGRHAV